MAKNNLDFGLPSYDSLFTSEEERQEAQLEKVVKIPIEEISDFKNHPFGIRMDEDMIKLIDSIQENGLLMPVLVRPSKDGNGYEMIAGHRRKFASLQTGAKEIDAIVRDLDDDQATILMVDSNIQREHILPTERGYAYKMRLDAMKHQGKRNDLTCAQVEHKLEYNKKARDNLAEALGVNRNQIQRYIRLTELIEPLQEMVDDRSESGISIAFLPAYEFSYLTKEHQEMLVDVIYETLATPSLSQAQQIKKASQMGMLYKDSLYNLLSNEKPNQKEKLTIKMDKISKYFPKEYTPEQMTDVIVKLLGNWQRKRERLNER